MQAGLAFYRSMLQSEDAPVLQHVQCPVSESATGTDELESKLAQTSTEG
jgi:hypothetical protein